MMINFSVYLSAGLSVLIALWVIVATFKFVATAFIVQPEKEMGNK